MAESFRPLTFMIMGFDPVKLKKGSPWRARSFSSFTDDMDMIRLAVAPDIVFGRIMRGFPASSAEHRGNDRSATSATVRKHRKSPEAREWDKGVMITPKLEEKSTNSDNRKMSQAMFFFKKQRQAASVSICTQGRFREKCIRKKKQWVGTEWDAINDVLYDNVSFCLPHVTVSTVTLKVAKN